VKKGDVMVMELGRFNDNSCMTRLVNVRVDEVSFDAKKALVKLLPPHPEKKDTIRAERMLAGRSKIVDTCHLFLDEQQHRDSCEFHIGDVVIWTWGSSEHHVATVIKVKKTSLTLLTSEGTTCELGHRGLMVVSRPSNQNDPGITEPKNNG